MVPICKYNWKKIYDLCEQNNHKKWLLDTASIETTEEWVDNLIQGIILLLNSDKKQYSSLLVNFYNNF